ncbi:MAG: glutamine--fructose-6-phosphate aminotransferase, partial [Gemmatimonadetes bacterium 21-71-4]
MCGIVGYVGPRKALPVLLAGLKRLEYRGYDSAGVALVTDGRLVIQKAAGKIAALEAQLGRDGQEATTGIAHTRWATHGAPTSRNAHPHTDCAGIIALAHNGIIENHMVLRQMLVAKGHRFVSDTDTEALAHLIEQFYQGSLEEAVATALQEVEGTYGIVVVSVKEPDTIVAARSGSPLLLGLGNGEHFVASDPSAVLAYTRSVVYLDEGNLAVITPGGDRVKDRHAVPLNKEVSQIDWDLATIERGGFPHFMLKEICEQPESIRNTLRGRLLDEEGTARLGGLNLTDEDLLKVDRVVLTACGTSWHAALVG